jgi:hypothetical protein
MLATNSKIDEMSACRKIRFSFAYRPKLGRLTNVLEKGVGVLANLPSRFFAFH